MSSLEQVLGHLKLANAGGGLASALENALKSASFAEREIQTRLDRLLGSAEPTTAHVERRALKTRARQLREQLEANERGLANLTRRTSGLMAWLNPGRGQLIQERRRLQQENDRLRQQLSPHALRESLRGPQGEDDRAKARRYLSRRAEQARAEAGPDIDRAQRELFAVRSTKAWIEHASMNVNHGSPPSLSLDGVKDWTDLPQVLPEAGGPAPTAPVMPVSPLTPFLAPVVALDQARNRVPDRHIRRRGLS